MRRVFEILKWSLQIWGVLSFIAALLIGGFFAYLFGPGNRTKVNYAKKKDVQFILNDYGIKNQQIEKVIYSYRSSRSITGDYLNAYAITIANSNSGGLFSASGDFKEKKWYRGDQLPKIPADAVSFIGSWDNINKIPWFPKEAELRSNDVFIKIGMVFYFRNTTTATEIVFVKPSDRMIYYIKAQKKHKVQT
jgi:cbb3-type cytochrome oxidase subunit 3